MKKLLLCVIFIFCSTSALALPIVPSQATLGFSGELSHDGEVFDVHGSVAFNLIAISDEYNELVWHMELASTNKDVSVIGSFVLPHDGDSFDWSGAKGTYFLSESVLPDYYIESVDAWVDRTFDSDHTPEGELAGLGTDIFPRHIAFRFDNGGGDWDAAAFSADLYGQPVPEPGTILLLGTGILGVAGYRRNSKKQNSTDAI